MAADELPTAGPSPAPPTSIQTIPAPETPPGGAVRVELPAPPAAAPAPPVFSEARARLNARLDAVLVALVLAFAFLLASSLSVNSDLWVHLAAGRDLLTGTYHFGADPFAHTTAGVYWVNHSWLFDVIVYGLFRAAGGAGLVVAKALLVVVLAWFLMRLGRVGRSWWLPAVCAALAMLTAAPRLLLQPTGVSFLFLALTLWFLERPRRRGCREPSGTGSDPGPARLAGPTSGPVSFAAYWPLLALFVFWVNLDDWFLLGPLTVALYALGRLLDSVTSLEDGPAVRPGEVKSLGLVLVAGLAACLLNPHHVRVFTLPFPLGVLDAAPALGQDPIISRLMVSPFQADYFRIGIYKTPAGMAYFVLVVLSLLSFLPAFVSGRGVAWWRVLLWLGLLLLSAYHARAIPFFAVVAGPILALNLGEWIVRQAQQPQATPDGVMDLRPYTPAWGRALTVTAAVLVVAATWPGWMQGGPYGPRQWGVYSDPSLEGAARQLAQWREEGKLGADVAAFNTGPDSANYFAWACPGQKGFFDARLPLFTRTAGEYMAVRRGLEGMPAEGDPDWRQILRDRNVRLLILHERSFRIRPGLLRHLLEASGECPLLYLDGRTAIFGWRDLPGLARKGPDPFAGLLYNWNRPAFAPTEAERAPAAWPGREPRPWHWWEAFVRSQAHTAAARDEASADLIHFQALSPPFRVTNEVRGDLALEARLLGNLAQLGGGAAGPAATGALNIAQALRPTQAPMARPRGKRPPSDLMGLAYRSAYLWGQDDGPPGLLFMAVRAGRRALHDDPDDPQTYLDLAESYMLLSHNTRERSWEEQLPLLKRLRQVQAVTAFQQALRLNPRLAPARGGLIRLYKEMKAGDLMLREMKKLLERMEAEGPRGKEGREKYAERLEQLRGEVAQLTKQVDDVLDLFEVNAAHLKVANRAQVALSKGLTGKALDILLESNIAAFGTAGMQLELQLLLSTGDVGKFREYNSPDQKKELGALQYGWMRAQLGAATGDYEEADQSLREMIAALSVPGPSQEAALSDQQKLAEDFGFCMLNGSTLVGRVLQLQASMRSGMLVDNLHKRADLTVLRAALALESGRTADAERLLRGALSLYRDKAGRGTGLDFAAREPAEQMLAWITARR